MSYSRTALGALLISCAGCIDRYVFLDAHRDASSELSQDGADGAVVTDVNDAMPPDVPDVVVPVCTGNPITQLRAFDGTTCAIRRNGQLFCWGVRSRAMNSSADPSTPLLVATDVTSVVSGGGVGIGFQLCFIRNRTVFCAGTNTDGQVGRPPGPGVVPIDMPNELPLAGVEQISASNLHVCALLPRGTDGQTSVACWGNAGDNRTNNAGAIQPTWGTPNVFPVTRMLSGVTVRSIHSAGKTNYAVVDTGSGMSLVGWGRNEFGTFPDALADLVTPSTNLPSTSSTSMLTGLFVSPRLVCQTSALLPSSLECIGATDSGVLGQSPGVTTTWRVPGSPPPIAVMARQPLVAVGSNENAPASGFACVVRDDARNRVACIGSNGFAQLGASTEMMSASWRDVVSAGPVGDGSDITHITAGAAHGCVRTTLDGVFCWGRAGCGERGDMLGTTSCTPVPSGAPSEPLRVPNRVVIPCS